MNQKLITSLLLLILITNTASAFDISWGWQEDTEVRDELDTVYKIINENDMYVEHIFHIALLENFSLKHPVLRLRIDPWEHLANLPPVEFGVKICDWWVYGEFDTFNDSCSQDFKYNWSSSPSERSLIIEGVDYRLINSTDYTINVWDFNTTDYKVLSFSIKYVIPNFIQKQGDDYFAHLTYQNLDEFPDINNHFFFPDEKSVPKYIQEDVRIRRFVFLKDNTPYYKWKFEFEGDKDRIFFYNDYKELEQKEIKLQDKYFWRGFLVAILISLVFLVLELLFGYQLRIKLRKWWNHFFKIKGVYGNSNTKVYHLQNCAYIDNIDEKSMKIFKSVSKAEMKGYKPCNLCKPKD